MSRCRIWNKPTSPVEVQIALHVAAPAKPEFGQSCNGCGACCAAEPCPVSRTLLGHREGSCPALLWSDDDQRYFCGMARSPDIYMAWLPNAGASLMARACRRWISAGSGCDFDAQVS